MDSVIRPSTIEDSEEIGAVHTAACQAAYRGIIDDDDLDNLDPAANAERRRSRFVETVPGAVELVAQVGDRIAGFAGYGRARDPVPDDWGELQVTNLHPDFWRHGVGSRLFAAAVAGLREAGYRHGYLWVVDRNERALSFYRRQGWLPGTGEGATKIDHRFTPPLRELRCSAALIDDRRR